MKEKNKYVLKAITYAVAYWVLFIIFPFIFTGYIVNEQSFFASLFGSVFAYILFVAPLLFVIPFKLSKLVGVREKVAYILIGLVAPYIAVYAYAYYGLTHMQIGLF